MAARNAATRRTLLRLLLSILLAVNLVVAAGLLFRLQRGDFAGIRSVTQLVGFLLTACLLNAVALAATWNGRRWGVWLLFVVAVVVGLVNYQSGFSILKSVGGLIPPLLVFILARPILRESSLLVNDASVQEEQ